MNKKLKGGVVMSEYMKGYNEGYNACLKKISQMLSSANQTIHKDIKCSKCKEIMIIDIMEDGCEVTCNSCNKKFQSVNHNQVTRPPCGDCKPWPYRHLESVRQ